MFDDILVPTDGSDCAEVAVDYAEDLAMHYDTTVHVLCVADSRTLENAPHSERVREASTEIAGAVGDEIATANVSIEEAVRTDVPHKAILRYADEKGIDLIVMGTHGRTGVERFLLGSVTEKVIRLSDVPVLTVRADASGDIHYPYEEVLVPTDGSERSDAAIDPAVDIASRYDARLHALSVVDTMSLGVDVRSDIVIESLEESARSAVDTVAERARQASVSTVKTTVEIGLPYREIGSYVEDNDIDLVVMGTHGRSGIDRYLLGSVTEKLVRTSPAPVMTVRMPESSFT